MTDKAKTYAELTEEYKQERAIAMREYLNDCQEATLEAVRARKIIEEAND